MTEATDKYSQVSDVSCHSVFLESFQIIIMHAHVKECSNDWCTCQL